MAFTDMEKLKIYTYLGWPAATNDPNSISYSKIATDRLLNRPAVVEERARYYIDRLDKLDDSLTTAVNRAGVKRIDDIELNGMEMQSLRSEKNRLLRELATLLDLAILNAGGSSQGCVIV